jgi:hypothetical protein
MMLSVVSPECCQNLSPIFSRILEVSDVDLAILPPVAAPPVLADPALRVPRGAVIAVIQDQQLHVTEKGFHRIVVGAGLGEAHPVQVQRPHDVPRLPRLARVGRVLVQGDPRRCLRIPTP